MMFTYGPKLYELQPWSTAGDADYLLDSHTQAAIGYLASWHACVMEWALMTLAPAPASSAVLNSLAHLSTRSHSHSRTPPCETKMERSHSSSVSSTHSQEIKPKSSVGSGGKDSDDSDSASQEGNETNEEDKADTNGEAPRDGEDSDGQSSGREDSNGGGEIADHDAGVKESNSKAEGSDAESTGPSSSKTDEEILTRVATPTKETKGGNPNSSQMLSLPDLSSKDTKEEQKVQQHKDAWLLNRKFSKWHNRMISKGHAEWKKCDMMICDHMDPCKEAKFPDHAGLPPDYMKHCGLFKSKKTNEYDLCHFY